MASIEIALLDIPEDAELVERAVIRARYLLNALFAGYGVADLDPRENVLPASKAEDAFAVAIAMIHASQDSIVTPKQFRDAAERVTSNIRKSAMAMRDDLSDQQRASMGMRSSRPN